jgi:hypothetical protein
MADRKPLLSAARPKLEESAGRRIMPWITLLVALIALAIGAAGWFFPNNDASFRALSQNDTALSDALAAANAQIAASNVQITQLQSQLVEIMMESGNATLLQNGTFLWGVSISQDNVFPFATCNTGQSASGFTMVSAGTGYRVGDLITLIAEDPDYALWFWTELPVLRVDTVDGSGAVLTFTTLTGGCFGYESAPGTTMDTLSVVGSGFTVQISGLYAPSVFNTYYDYPTPPTDLGAGLQYAQYSLYQVEIHGVFFTVLYLEPPPLTMHFAPYGYWTHVAVTTLEFNLYNFQPPVAELTTLGSASYIFPLTQKNVGAINFQDDYNCWATGDCYLDLDFLGQDKLKAIQFHTYLQQFGVKQHSWIRFRINPPVEVPILNGAFTLNYPFMLVLPSL